MNYGILSNINVGKNIYTICKKTDKISFFVGFMHFIYIKQSFEKSHLLYNYFIICKKCKKKFVKFDIKTILILLTSDIKWYIFPFSPLEKRVKRRNPA